jgi:hypothetical protein
MYLCHVKQLFFITIRCTLLMYFLLVQGRRIKMRCPVKVLTGIFHPILLSAF